MLKHYDTLTHQGIEWAARKVPGIGRGTARTVADNTEMVIAILAPTAAMSKLGQSSLQVARAGSAASSGKIQLYSYFKRPLDTERAITATSGRVYLTTRAPGAWLTDKGVRASLTPFMSTGRWSEYPTTDRFFTTGPINPIEWGLKPILPRTTNFWKSLGGQYHSRIGISGFETAEKGSNLLINSPISSTAWQTWQARGGLAVETAADLGVIFIIGARIYSIAD